MNKLQNLETELNKKGIEPDNFSRVYLQMVRTSTFEKPTTVPEDQYQLIRTHFQENNVVDQDGVLIEEELIPYARKMGINFMEPFDQAQARTGGIAPCTSQRKYRGSGGLVSCIDKE